MLTFQEYLVGKSIYHADLSESAMNHSDAVYHEREQVSAIVALKDKTPEIVPVKRDANES